MSGTNNVEIQGVLNGIGKVAMLEDIPQEIRQKIAALICRKVDERLKLELDMFRGETAGAIEFQRHNHHATMGANVSGKLGDDTDAAWVAGTGGIAPYGGKYADLNKRAYLHGVAPWMGHHPYYGGYGPYAGYGYGYYGGQYGHTGYVPKDVIAEEMVAAHASYMSGSKQGSPNRRQSLLKPGLKKA